MTATLDLPPVETRPANGGLPARRAVVRWAWRLFRAEWRQQALILALIVLAVGGTVVGSAVATNTPPPKSDGFGTAQNSASLSPLISRTPAAIASLQRRFGRVEVIENETQSVPGSISAYQIRAQDPHGFFSRPMLSLRSGSYPTTGDQVAVTDGVATEFNLKVGSSWMVGGVQRTVTGIVRNPQSFLDEFALVLPGQVTHPTSVTALFDARGASLDSIGDHAQTPASLARSNPLNPETISLAAMVLGMVLIALVSVGGFTVLAQRRLRSIGMLKSTGATDRQVRLVVTANGAVVGTVGAILGFVVGLVVWEIYRPRLERSAHHVVGRFALSWPIVVASVLLAIVAAVFAASRPARAMTKVPIVQALSGRPAPARQVRRSAIPGIGFLVGAFLLLGIAGGTRNGTGSGGSPELLLGLVLLIPGLILLAPFFLSLAALVGHRAPLPARLALRDLARYRARSGSALAAISVGILVSSIVMLAAAARYGNVLDYVGPNLASNQLAIHQDLPPQGARLVHRNARGQLVPVPGHPQTRTATPQQQAVEVAQLARGLGAQDVPLESPAAQFAGTHLGRNWNGPIYVATPQLLRAFGIDPSSINPSADALTSRPGLSGVSGLHLYFGTDAKLGPPSSSTACTAAKGCLAHPLIQEIGGLPRGTSAPNTVITQHAMNAFHIKAATTDWLLRGQQSFTAAQIDSAQHAASSAQLAVESRNHEPTSFAIITWATIFGMVIALGVLGMSVGLVRSETANELRTLAASGASSFTRRTITAVTAGSLGLIGALLGTLGGYIAMLGWLRSNSLNGGVASLQDVPVTNLLILILAMPGFAALVGWTFAGRQPEGMARQAIE